MFLNKTLLLGFAIRLEARLNKKRPLSEHFRRRGPIELEVRYFAARDAGDMELHKSLNSEWRRRETSTSTPQRNAAASLKATGDRSTNRSKQISANKCSLAITQPTAVLQSAEKRLNQRDESLCRDQEETPRLRLQGCKAARLQGDALDLHSSLPCPPVVPHSIQIGTKRILSSK